MSAADNRGRYSNAVISITVTRDQLPPRWLNLPHEVGRVSENSINNTGVFTIRATDDDLLVCFFSVHIGFDSTLLFLPMV